MMSSHNEIPPKGNWEEINRNMLTVEEAVGVYQKVKFPRLAVTSRESYSKKLAQLTIYFDGVLITDVSDWHLEIYISTLHEPRQLNPRNTATSQGTYSKATIANHVRVVRAFFNWCYQRSIIDLNPADRLRPPKTGEKPTRTIPGAHLRLLLAELENKPRDICIVHLMLYSGLRVSEVVNLDIENVDLSNRFLSVKGKGAKPRYVPITNQTRTLLLTYILGFRPRGRALFGSVGGKKRKDGEKRLTRSGIRQMLERRCAAAGIPTYSPHQFRHTFATNAVKNGAGELWLQLVLGHEPGSKATRRYVHTSKEVLLKQFDLVVR